MSRKCFAAAAQMLCALVSGLQAGCTHTQPASMETETDNRERERYEVEKAKYEPLVGRTLWVTANGRFQSLSGANRSHARLHGYSGTPPLHD